MVDIVCTYGPRDRPFEEHFRAPSISFVLSGSFVYRSARGSSLMSSGTVLLGNAGQAFECSISMVMAIAVFRSNSMRNCSNEWLATWEPHLC